MTGGTFYFEFLHLSTNRISGLLTCGPTFGVLKQKSELGLSYRLEKLSRRSNNDNECLSLAFLVSEARTQIE